MLYVDKSTNFNIPFQMKNKDGGIVDITSATVTCYVKESPTAVSNVFTKVSTDSAQLEKTSATSGLGIVKVLAANTSSLTKRVYYYEITDTTNKVSGFFTIKQNYDTVSSSIAIHGTTAERTALGLTLTSNDRIWFYDDTTQSPWFWSGTAWT